MLRNPDADYLYLTDNPTPTRYRIIREDQGDDWPWLLDGIDDAGNYTEDVRTFATHAEAVAALPDFAAENPLTPTATEDH